MVGFGFKTVVLMSVFEKNRLNHNPLLRTKVSGQKIFLSQTIYTERRFVIWYFASNAAIKSYRESAQRLRNTVYQNESSKRHLKFGYLAEALAFLFVCWNSSSI